MEEIKIQEKNKVLKSSHVLGLSVTIYIAAAVVGGFAATAVASYMEDGGSSYVNITSIMIALIACPVMYRLLRNGGLWQFRGCTWKKAIGYAALGLFLAYIVQTAIEYSIIVFDLYDHESVQELYRLNEAGMGGNVILRVSGLMIAPAICEEMLFRAAMFLALRTKRGFLFSAVVSSLIFGAAHDLGLYMLIGFLVGMILCIVLEITQSIMVPMLIHFCNNLLANLTVSKIGNAYEFEGMAGNVVLMIVLWAASIVIFTILMKRILYSGREEKVVLSQKKGVAL